MSQQHEHEKVVGKDSKANFGTRGWLLVLFGLMSLFYVGSIQNESMNVVIPKLMELHGWGDGQISRITGYATFIGAMCVFFWNPVVRKFGAKWPAVIALAVVGIGMSLQGYVTSVGAYAVIRILTVIGTMSVMNYFLGVLVINWFPTKKGVAMGYITVGNNLASIVCIWMLTGLWSSFGFGGGSIAYGLLGLLPIAVLVFALDDYPEKFGLFPDNDTSMTREEADKMLEEGRRYEETSPWTVKRLLVTPQVWKIAVALGLLCLTISGILTHLVAIFTSRGYDQTSAMLAMTICSVLAIPLSIFLGVIDTKYGARIATIGLAVVMAVCFFVSVIDSKWSVFFAGFAAAAVMGCLNNVATSLPASIFGRYDMKRAQSVIIPIMQTLQAIGVGLTGTLAEKTGGFTAVMGLMGVCSIVGALILLTLKDECIGRIE